MIYLDNNSTTNIRQEVINRIQEIQNLGPLNPSSIHSFGRKARSIVEDSRRNIAQLVGVKDVFANYRITFTSGGTEANNLILSNFYDAEIFISAVEHHSIFLHNKFCKNIKIIKVDNNGIIDLEDLELKLKNSKSKAKLVSVMLANNETGVIQPISEISKIAHDNGALIHSDIVQAVGKMKIDLLDLDVDFASISAHKFGGPMGAGALISKSNIDLKPMIIGGGQEKSLRSGTENIPAISGFGMASSLVLEELDDRIKHMSKLRDYLENNLLSNFPDIKIAGYESNRLCNTSLIVKKNKNAQTQIIAFDLKGVAVSSGSACSSGKVGQSHVLESMMYEQQEIKSAIRVSVGVDNTMNEIENFLKIYSEING